jgi:hypothetical protein
LSAVDMAKAAALSAADMAKAAALSAVAPSMPAKPEDVDICFAQVVAPTD